MFGAENWCFPKMLYLFLEVYYWNYLYWGTWEAEYPLFVFIVWTTVQRRLNQYNMNNNLSHVVMDSNIIQQHRIWDLVTVIAPEILLVLWKTEGDITLAALGICMQFILYCNVCSALSLSSLVKVEWGYSPHPVGCVHDSRNHLFSQENTRFINNVQFKNAWRSQ